MNFNSPYPSKFPTTSSQSFRTPSPSSSIPRPTSKFSKQSNLPLSSRSTIELKEIYQKLDAANFQAGNAPSPSVSNYLSDKSSNQFTSQIGSPRQQNFDNQYDGCDKKSKNILLSPVKSVSYEDDDEEDDYVTTMTSIPITYEYHNELDRVEEDVDERAAENQVSESIDDLNTSLAHLSTDSPYISPSSLTSCFYNYLKNFKKLSKKELFQEDITKSSEETIKEKYNINKIKDIDPIDLFNYSFSLLEESNQKVNDLYRTANPFQKNPIMNFFNTVYKKTKNRKMHNNKNGLISIEEEEVKSADYEENEIVDEDFIQNFYSSSHSLSETKNDDSLDKFVMSHFGLDLLNQLYRESFEFNGE